MHDCIIDPGRSNHKYKDYLKKIFEEFTVSHNNCVFVKPNIVVLYKDDGVKSRHDFQVSVIDYWAERKTYTAHFDSFRVKTQMVMTLGALTDNSINYEMYLEYEDSNKKLTYIPVSIVKIEAKYIVLKEDEDEFADIMSNLFEEMTKGTPIWYDDKSFDMPQIGQIWYNEPYTTIKWTDGSTTTSKCSENETFSKEVGVAMCISKKYLECRGFEYQRKAFKFIVGKGVDLKAIHDKRNRTKALKRAIDMAKAGYSIDDIEKTLNLTDDDALKKALDMAKVGYSIDDIKKTLNSTEDDILDLFKDASTKE